MTIHYYPFVPSYSELPQWLLDAITLEYSNGDIIVEAGCGFGQNIHYLMENLAIVHKKPKLYAFDTFGEGFTSEFYEGHPQTTPWGEPFYKWVARIGGAGRLIDQFAFHLKNNPAKEYLTDWAQFPHWTVAEEFKDDSVSFVIANGSHKPKNIKQELIKWWPKLKKHGKIALYGHNSQDFKVKLEVAREFFSDVKAYSLDVSPNHVIIVHP